MVSVYEMRNLPPFEKPSKTCLKKCGKISMFSLGEKSIVWEGFASGKAALRLVYSSDKSISTGISMYQLCLWCE